MFRSSWRRVMRRTIGTVLKGATSEYSGTVDSLHSGVGVRCGCVWRLLGSGQDGVRVDSRRQRQQWLELGRSRALHGRTSSF